MPQEHIAKKLQKATWRVVFTTPQKLYGTFLKLTKPIILISLPVSYLFRKEWKIPTELTVFISYVVLAQFVLLYYYPNHMVVEYKE